MESSSFLQTPIWEKFQQQLGRSTYWLDGVLFIRYPLTYGQDYWYAPRVDNVPDIAHIDQAFRGHTTFVKIEPVRDSLDQLFKPTYTTQPRQTLILDLKGSEDQLLENMKAKTRYNIRLAERKHISVSIYDAAESIKHLGEFMALTKETNLRDQIKSYDVDYYQKLLLVLGEAKMANLAVAYFEGQPLSGLILIRHQKTATYLFGASNNQQRNLMSPYLLQWEAIRFAKKSGCDFYDWWGIRVDSRLATGTPTSIDQVQPTPGKTYGVTKFKLGFGGEPIFYPPAFNRSYKQFWYNLYQTYHNLTTSYSGFNY